jgi:hypothetical protein
MANRYRPWHPTKVNKGNDLPIAADEIRRCDAVAIQAVAKGVASEDQQKMALAAIFHVCGINEMDWMPEEHGGDRETSFAAGKRFVGLQLRKITTLPLLHLTGEANVRDRHDRSTGKPADERNSDRAKQ